MIRPLLTVTLAAALFLVACSEDSTNPGPDDSPAQLLSVIPGGGSTGVDPNAPLAVVFTHAMMMDMTDYMVLHEGDVRGPVVAGSWTWNAEGTRAVFTPASSLKPGTSYTLHMGGAMTDAEGHPVGLDEHGSHMGGQTATGAMMGMMGGGGMMVDSVMMGPGWRHAEGTYGMVFTFTTG